ncbi:PH domain-containing protein [Bacillus sp. Marseille-Q1617]|uniref:PH domain-containing protein n=1 Tax=Bacillus sp. Marseille-Q1617 TaxID=2736887 RepID=UPI00158EC4B6|nr:PH domain-containing protein [Bacillus sp. Marseille-Q1617]
MYIHIDEPTETISKNAAKVWRISNSIGHTIVLIIIGILLLCSDKFDWYNWIGITLYVLGGLFIVSAAFSIFIEPVYLQKTWRYQVDKEFVQLKFGRWEQQHILIPMEKVEYVRTEQGPLLRRYGLYDLEVGTTASSHKIPAIPEDVAKTLKAQIATFAKITDKDSEEGEIGA